MGRKRKPLSAEELIEDDIKRQKRIASWYRIFVFVTPFYYATLFMVAFQFFISSDPETWKHIAVSLAGLAGVAGGATSFVAILRAATKLDESIKSSVEKLASIRELDQIRDERPREMPYLIATLISEKPINQILSRIAAIMASTPMDLTTPHDPIFEPSPNVVQENDQRPIPQKGDH